MLKDTIESVLRQNSKDWEQLFLVDRTGRHLTDPILWANQQFERYQEYVSGDYVYPLDDDGVLVDEGFLQAVMENAEDNPDVFLVKITTPYYDGKLRIWPEEHVWNLAWEAGERPSEWAGNGYNVVTRTDVWKRHLHHYQQPRGGDWFYITSLIQADLYIKRIDIVAGKSMMRGAGVIFEKCGDNWFEPIAKEYGLRQLAESVWILNA